MGAKYLRVLTRRPLFSPGFLRGLLLEFDIHKRFKPEEILYLTPNKRRARSAQFEILSLYKKNIHGVPFCIDLQGLARSLVISRSLKGIVDEQDREYILYKIIGEENPLFFNNEHLGLLSRLYADLKRHHPDDWDDIPKQAETAVFDIDSANRLKEAVKLLRCYEGYLDAHGLVDHEGLLKEACGEVASFSQKLVIIEGFFEPWVSEKRLFVSIFERIPEVVVIVPEDTKALDGERFFRSQGLVQQNAAKPLAAPPSSWNRYPSREDEVVSIARRICALAASDGAYADEIIVVFPALEVYRPIVARVFRRYGLEANISYRPHLNSLPAFRLVLDLLETAERGFHRRDLVGLLLSPSFDDVPSPVRRWLDVLSRDEGIISGEGEWVSSFLSELPKRLKGQIDAPGIIREIRDFLSKFIRELKKLTQPLPVADFIRIMYGILKQLGWRIDETTRQGFEEALEKLVRMVELCRERVVTLRFVRETLELLMSKEVPELNDGSDSGTVRVMPVVETRWLDAKYLFFGGLIDGEFPKRPFRDLLLPERLRKALNLPGVEDAFSDAEFEFRRLTSLSSKFTFLSAPSMEADRPLLPSIYIAERKEDLLPDDFTIYCEEEQELLNPLTRPEVQAGVLFSSPQSLEMTEKRFGSKYPFRVTVLETYLACPYRYYLNAVLELEPFEEPVAEPEGALLGTIIHDTLSRLFLENAEADTLDERLMSCLRHELNTRRLNSFVRLWIEDWVNARKEWFRDEEKAREESGWLIDKEWLEKPLELYFANESFTLKGRVDRVDWRNGNARVLDYKTGKEENFEKKLKKGESIQLPLYSEIIKRLSNALIESFGLYSFNDTSIKEVKPPEDSMRAAVHHASTVVTGIRQGRFPAAKQEACRYCEFYEFCG